MKLASTAYRYYYHVYFPKIQRLKFMEDYNINRSQDSSVSIGMGYGLDGLGSIPGRGKRFLSSPLCQKRLWGPPSLLSNGYQDLFTWEQSGRGMKLTTHLHLVPRSRMEELYLHSPIRLHVWWLNKHKDNFTLPLQGSCVHDNELLGSNCLNGWPLALWEALCSVELVF
jgi:hypothetical protein